MENNFAEIIDGSEILKKYYDYPKEELLIMRTYFAIGLAWVVEKNEEGKLVKLKAIKGCLDENYNFITYMLNMKLEVDTRDSSGITNVDLRKKFRICDSCKLKHCIKDIISEFICEIDTINQRDKTTLKYLDVIEFILKRDVPEFKVVPKFDFFSNVSLIDLITVQVILEGDFVKFLNYDDESKTVECNILDLTDKGNNPYYINYLYEFYKNGMPENIVKLNISDLKSIEEEKTKNYYGYIYKLTAYYKYLIEIEKMDIISALREHLKNENKYENIAVRSHYFIYRYFQKVSELPYSEECKKEIYKIFNYILNYNYLREAYIPINMVIYSNDREAVENIGGIIGEFMWYFGYLPNNMKYYHEFMNNIVLDKFAINKLFYAKENDIMKRKIGVLYFHNFESISYTEKLNKNLILNIFSDELSKNNNDLCTIIYGEKEVLDNILYEYPKLNKYLFNIKLDINELSTDKIYQILIDKLNKKGNLSKEVSEKLYDYIKADYSHSENKGMEYVNMLYNSLILKKNSEYKYNHVNELKVNDIPEIYNVRNLPETLNDLNKLVGLSQIKAQINDLIYLLKFNQKANLDVSKLNLHMIFTGNPGTGKTTVARLISNILYNLGYIRKNKLVEVSAKDLIADYVGQTSGKTYSVLKSAFGGVLFIDEAYSITNSPGNFGADSIATILKTMEDYRDKIVIIFAGYKKEMEDFVKSNPGLASRIGYRIDFEDYTVDELMDIMQIQVEKNKLKLTPEASDKLREIISKSLSVKDFGNARYVCNLFQKVLINHAKNVDLDENTEDIYLITSKDIEENLIAVNDAKRTIGFTNE